MDLNNYQVPEFDNYLDNDLELVFKQWKNAENDYKQSTQNIQNQECNITELELIMLICYIVSLQYFIKIHNQQNIYFLIILHYIIYVQLIVFFFNTFKYIPNFSHDKIILKKQFKVKVLCITINHASH